MAKNIQPAHARYKDENHKLKNKIRKLEKYLKTHPNDVSTSKRLEELRNSK